MLTLEELWNAPEHMGPKEALKAAKVRQAAKLAAWVEAQKAKKA
jgi:hypothetical protein